MKAVIYTFIPAHIKRNANNDRRLVYRRGRFMGTKPVFVLDNTDTPVLKKRPQRYEDFSYSRVWALLRMAYLKLGPRPSLELTKSLILAMKDRVESLGAEFIVVDWDQDWSNPEYGDLILDSIDLNLIDTGDNPPNGWKSWVIPGDKHPTKAANSHVAALILSKLKELNLL